MTGLVGLCWWEGGTYYFVWERGEWGFRIPSPPTAISNLNL